MLDGGDMIVGLYNLPSMQIADSINIQTISGNIDLVLHYTKLLN